MGFFQDLFGGGAEKDAANKNRAQYTDYLQKGQGYLQAGLDNAMQSYGDAKNDYAPLQALGQKYGAGTDMYLNALGLNGAAGTQAAQSAFQAGPGYQWQVGQGLDAINRRRAAAGMSNSGNADLDALTYGQGLAKQEYGNWLNGLSGINGQNVSITGAVASGLSGIDQQRAGTYYQNANDLTNLQGNYTQGMTGANNLEAQGRANGAKNLLNLGLGLGNLAVGGMGGSFGGLGSIGKGLGSLGITYGNPGTSWSNMQGPVA